MTTSDRYRHLAQAATTVRRDAEALFDARASRAAWQLLQSARGVERELWTTYVTALGQEIAAWQASGDTLPVRAATGRARVRRSN